MFLYALLVTAVAVYTPLFYEWLFLIRTIIENLWK